MRGASFLKKSKNLDFVVWDGNSTLLTLRPRKARSTLKGNKDAVEPAPVWHEKILIEMPKTRCHSAEMLNWGQQP